MVDQLVRRVSGYAPIVMSLLCFAVIAEAIFEFGSNRPRTKVGKHTFSKF
jgi:hypothetical protein